MADEYFDKPTPRRPLMSEASVRMICGTALLFGAGWFSHLHPDIATKVLSGLACFAVVVIFLAVAR